MINWQFFPKSKTLPDHLRDVIDVFEKNLGKIDSEKHKLESNDVLSVIRPGLIKLAYKVEKSKKAIDKIKVPVLFGRNGKLEKSFEADAYFESENTVLEVEAGRGVTNYQFLKDLFQACMMHDVNFLVIAIRNTYRTSKDFEKVIGFIDTLYASNRLDLPLKGILIVGY
mgnify:CR=1 FL=1|tara:strand:- start:772 stop:1278 length:507 start_codon:yes stop_codon:yes gene_type:complete